MLLPSSAAFAQGREDTPLEVRLIMSSTLTTSMSPTISLLFIQRKVDREKEELKKEIEEYKQYVMIEHYMKESSSDVADAVTLGEGEALHDLAAILQIPKEDYDVWSKAVREDRAAVMQALELDDGFEQAMKLHGVLVGAYSQAKNTLASNTLQSMEVRP